MYKVLPDRLMTLQGMSIVRTVIVHPAGTKPAGSPIRPDLQTIECKMDNGARRWFGARHAIIASDLRIHFGPVDSRDEVMRGWEDSDELQ